MLRCVAVDILAATTVVLQGHSSRTDAKSRAVRNIDLECRATLPLREETKSLFLVFILQYCILWFGCYSWYRAEVGGSARTDVFSSCPLVLSMTS